MRICGDFIKKTHRNNRVKYQFLTVHTMCTMCKCGFCIKLDFAGRLKKSPKCGTNLEIQKERIWTDMNKLDELNRLESANSTDLDALCNAFGALLGAVFSPREDFWSPALTQMGRGLGGFIYLMDAYDDLKKDARHGSFNALAATKQAFGSDTAGFEARCHELLTQQMALCAQNFELLPILKDTPEGQLLHNTIYAGVWSKYALVKATRTPRKGKPNE